MTPIVASLPAISLAHEMDFLLSHISPECVLLSYHEKTGLANSLDSSGSLFSFLKQELTSIFNLFFVHICLLFFVSLLSNS